MLRKVLFAIVPMALLATTVNAEDSFFELDGTAISDAAIEIQEASLDNLDVDQLSADADSESGEDAIEACFRRIRYRSCGWYRPYHCRTYYSYPSYYCYRPVYRYTYPITVMYRNYWGCY